VLALAGGVDEEVVQDLAAVAAGDDHGQLQLLAQRFEGAFAEALQIVNRLLGRAVVDASFLAVGLSVNSRSAK